MTPSVVVGGGRGLYATDLAPASTTFSPSVLRPMAAVDARAVHQSGVLHQCGDNCVGGGEFRQ